MKATLWAAVVLLFVSQAFAQVATIDTRNQSQTRPSISIGEGRYRSGGDQAKLQLSLSLPDPLHLSLGKPFDYELLVTNRSDEPVRLPRALTWSDMADAVRRDLRYQDSQISFEVFVNDGNLGFLHQGFTLYASESKPATLITLSPGESVRILGTTLFNPQWKRALKQSTGMRLMAFLTVSATLLRPSDEHPGSYRSEGQQVWNLESDGNLAIEIQDVR
jgi:hypothetical protein